MKESEDLNNISLTGTVDIGPSKGFVGEGYVVSFILVVRKKIRGTEDFRISRFRVVLFDGLASKHEKEIHAGRAMLIQGELDECRFMKGGKMQVETRVVGRFVKILEHA